MADPYLDPRGYRPFNSDSQDGKPSLASTADVLAVYEEAVQEPLVECLNLDSLYCAAQLDHTDRPEARILREDFCSSAIVAQTWLSLSPSNQSQAIDIDFSALSETFLKSRKGSTKFLQSPGFSSTGLTKELSFSEVESISPKSSSKETSYLEGKEEEEEKEDEKLEGKENGKETSTWDKGATSDRFERKFQARLQKQQKKKTKALIKKVSKSEEDSCRLTLVQSDVLVLPLPSIPASSSTSPPSTNSSTSPIPSSSVPPSNSASTSDSISPSALQPPDLIASLNYAMCYFHSRSTLIEYLTMVLKTLRPKTGVFVTDLFGGPQNGEKYQDQKVLWQKFEKEIGFSSSGRDARREMSGNLESKSRKDGKGKTRKEAKEKIAENGKRSNESRDEEIEEEEEDFLAGKVEIFPPPLEGTKGTPGEWPRGKLKMVRKGKEHGGFEYWREDGPLDFCTNRFRMSLSFRFKDASWLRDVFSYDFRAYSIKELTEALQEVGFLRVSVHVLPRNIIDRDQESESDSSSSEDEDEEGEGLGNFLTRTEKEERNRSSYRALKEGEKLFADRSFSTYIVACAP